MAKSLYRLSMEDHLISASEPSPEYSTQDAIELNKVENELEQGLDSAVEAQEAANILQDRLTINHKLSADPTQVTDELAQQSNECLSYCLGKLNIDYATYTKMQVSRESASSPRERLRVSNEGIIDIIKKILKAIGDFFKWLWRTIKGWFIALFRLFGFFKEKKKKKKKDIEELEKNLNKLKPEVREKIIKAVQDKQINNPNAVADIKDKVQNIDIDKLEKDVNLDHVEKFAKDNKGDVDKIAEDVIMAKESLTMLLGDTDNDEGIKKFCLQYYPLVKSGFPISMDVLRGLKTSLGNLDSIKRVIYNIYFIPISYNMVDLIKNKGWTIESSIKRALDTKQPPALDKVSEYIFGLVDDKYPSDAIIFPTKVQPEDCEVYYQVINSYLEKGDVIKTEATTDNANYKHDAEMNYKSIMANDLDSELTNKYIDDVINEMIKIGESIDDKKVSALINEAIANYEMSYNTLDKTYGKESGWNDESYVGKDLELQQMEANFNYFKNTVSILRGFTSSAGGYLRFISEGIQEYYEFCCEVKRLRLIVNAFESK